MTTTTADPHLTVVATHAFSDAWAAVYIDVAEKLAAEDVRSQKGSELLPNSTINKDVIYPDASPTVTTTETSPCSSPDTPNP